MVGAMFLLFFIYVYTILILFLCGWGTVGVFWGKNKKITKYKT